MDNDMYPRSNSFLDVVGRASAHVATAVLADTVANVFVWALIGAFLGVGISVYYLSSSYILSCLLSAASPILGAGVGYTHAVHYWKKALNRPKTVIVR